MTTPDAWHLFWAKTFPREGEDRAATDRLHPLWAHLIDVANVADLLWEHRVPPALRRRMADTLGLPPADARRWLSLWVGLHDVGKAVPFFQSQHGPSWERISNTPLAQPAPDTDRMHHGYASIPILYAWIDESASSAIVPDDVKPLARSLATFAGVHHGRITTGPRTMRRGVRGWGEGQKALGWTQMSGSHPWQQAQRSLIDAVADAWLDGVSAPSEAPDPWPPFLLHFAGWVTLADWLGSNASAFDAEAVTTDPVDATTQTVKGYLSISRERAHDAVATMGAASSPVVHSSFQTLYPEYESPRPIQRRALQRSHTGKPSLTIIEAPTGEGKTEAALLQAARQQKGRGEGGIYVAMPTQATSNSIFGRIAGFVKRATGRAEIDDLALVHGGADLHPSRRSSDEGDDTEEIYDEDGPDVGQVRTRAWFLPKKRGLLSPYGIGTVDQAFLGTLHVRHFFLRLFGLAGKTVIFDEVHAYDTYMARIFEQLLRWLKAVDAHVILLSATLPGSLRDQFLEAWDAARCSVSGNVAHGWRIVRPE